MAILESEPESLVLEFVDPKPETVVLGPERAAPRPKVVEAAMDYNYKDSDTQDVAEVHMC